MAYRVEYSWDRDKPQVQSWCGIRRSMLVLVFFFLFLLSVRVYWQQGRQVLMQLLFPGDRGSVAAAFSSMTRQLQQGTPVLEAAETVCLGLLHGAY